jgi:hypothetical protein
MTELNSDSHEGGKAVPEAHQDRNENGGHEGGRDGGGRRDDGHKVKITVNRVKYEILSGPHKVAEIKSLAGIPPADELAEVREGHDPKPLPDGGLVRIEGGEVFLSYPKDSGSS